MRVFRVVMLVAVVSLTVGVQAEQGMWMPQQIPALAAKLRALGFVGDPQSFADLTGQPMGAIVSLGGCTASFVSPEGLIVTNHHCGTGGLQFNSTPQKNLLADGYLAKTRDDELSMGPGSRVFVTTSVANVTADITGGIDPKTTDRERYDAIDRRIKGRVAACEKSSSRCTVSSFFEGLQYFEIAQLEIKDVRMVYAPAEGIGVFGGETDNWRWPRHTGDWTFLRAYVAKDGTPAAYSKDNVPYRPKHWLTIAPAGVKPNDLVFVVGYPGRTQRHQTYSEVKATTTWTLPRFVRLAEEQLAIIDKLSKDNPALAIKLAGRIQGLNNGLTNSRGVLEGLVKGGALAQKEANERELIAWIAASPARQQKYGGALSAMQTLQEQTESTRERTAVLNQLYSASSYLGAAQSLYRLSGQRTKPDVGRDAGFQERDWIRIRESLDRLQRTIDPTADRAFLGWALGYAAALPAGQRIEELDKAAGLTPGMEKAAAGAAINTFLDGLYAGTKLADQATRMSLFDKSTADVVATKDPFITLAASLEPMVETLREAAKDRSGAYARIRPVYMEALMDKAAGVLAPDANSTLRVTYGQVKGVQPRDGMFYNPQTTLAGIVEKQTGTGDFNAPKKQLDAIAAAHAGKKSVFYDPGVKDVPVNFLSTVDTTGGNSGSPTLNAKGELVGLLFDGTYESVSSDYLFDPIKTRSIHVDSRYMLWTMAEVDDAGNLLKEMGVSLVPPAPKGAPARVK
jgi:hypothetical protein